MKGSSEVEGLYIAMMKEGIGLGRAGTTRDGPFVVRNAVLDWRLTGGNVPHERQ